MTAGMSPSSCVQLEVDRSALVELSQLSHGREEHMFGSGFSSPLALIVLFICLSDMLSYLEQQDRRL